jgi:cell division septation protein DedD
MNTEESDITIGPGKLLGLFFMLVVICGIFFAIGYSLGKTSAREQALNDKNPLNASMAAPVVGDSSASKPSAAVVDKRNSSANDSKDDEKTPSGPDLTFFTAVKRSDRNAPPADTAKTDAGKPAATPVKMDSPAVVAHPTAVTDVATAKVPAKPEPQPVVSTTAAGGFVVQIAAVTREEDAAALAGALRKKNYSVFVVNNPTVHDKFYHVQIGPFASPQEAEAMKAKLTGEGYNPIVKKT